MAKLKVGDRVRIHTDIDYYNNKTGVVISVQRLDLHIRVQFDEPSYYPAFFSEDELERIDGK